MKYSQSGQHSEFQDNQGYIIETMSQTVELKQMEQNNHRHLRKKPKKTHDGNFTTN